MEGLLQPSAEVTQMQNHQTYEVKAFPASYVYDQQEGCNELPNPEKEKHPISTVPTAPLLSQFMVSYKQAVAISSYNTCD